MRVHSPPDGVGGNHQRQAGDDDEQAHQLLEHPPDPHAGAAVIAPATGAGVKAQAAGAGRSRAGGRRCCRRGSEARRGGRSCLRRTSGAEEVVTD